MPTSLLMYCNSGSLQDPAIKQMAEQIATDPAFKEVTESIQSTFANMMGGAPGAPGAVPKDPKEMAANFDPSKYMNAMTQMFQNPNFMQMAEKLGKSIIEVRLGQFRTAELPGSSFAAAIVF